MKWAAVITLGAIGLANPGATAADPVPHALYSKLALKGIRQEYPNKLEHVLTGDRDLRSPQALHPVFYGSYDWHSCVHGHWLLAHLLRHHPDTPDARAIREAFNEHFSAENVRAEVAYFERPSAKSFERPYGWAWLLKLAQELHGWEDADAKRWSAALAPLVDVVVRRYLDYFPKQTYPIRSGVHANTGFGLAFAHDFAVATKHDRLKALVESRAGDYFRSDTDAPARWEPSGADFLSPVLCEADLMARVLPREEFPKWFRAFLPMAGQAEPASLFRPATVTDRTDPQLVHLDGLNLSRAWCLRGIADALPQADPIRLALIRSADRHAEEGRKHVASGDYAGEHWLASFATYEDARRRRAETSR
jgi:hypothetical protein